MNAALPAGTCHLLVADDALTDGHTSGTYVAVCGELVTDLSHWSCPPGCECDPRYCPECVRAAIGWNAEVGQADRPPVERHPYLVEPPPGHPPGRSGKCPVLPLHPDRRRTGRGS